MMLTHYAGYLIIENGDLVIVNGKYFKDGDYDARK
jgi:hypothetical protein